MVRLYLRMNEAYERLENILRVKVTYLSDVPSVVVDLALTVGQLVCPELQNLGDDKRPFLGRRELVPPLGVLSQPMHQVAHLEVSGPNPSGVVTSQGLQVPRRV